MMQLFAVWASDHADALPARLQVREQHRARLRNPGAHAVRVLLAGPTLDASGMNGTMLVVRAADIDAVQAFVAADPYVLGGVYRKIEVRRWQCGLGPLVGAEDGAA